VSGSPGEPPTLVERSRDDNRDIESGHDLGVESSNTMPK
jgi:hypothetical protein